MSTPCRPRRAASLSPALLLFAVIAGASAAAAHDTWLLPAEFRAAPGATVRLAMTSGMAFPAEESPIAAERVARAEVRLAGALRALPALLPGAKASTTTLPPGAAGIAAVAIELKPRTLDLTSRQVVEYLDEIGASAQVRRAWRDSRDRRWHETYVKHAKTYVRIGEPGADRSWSEPCGMALELVPHADPTALRAGDTLPLRLLLHGKPLAGAAVGLVREGDAHGALVDSDSAGSVSVRFDRPGRWLLRVTHLVAGDRSGDWASDFSTLTLEVR